MSVCTDPTGITCLFVPFLGADLTVTPLSCQVDPDDIAQIPFTPGPDFLPAFEGPGDTVPYYPVTNGATPLLEALQEVDHVLSESNLDGDGVVVVVTDGEPNCAWSGPDAGALVADWAADGTRTYVIRLRGAGVAEQTSGLTSLSDAGATLVTVNSETMLLNALRDALAGR